MKRKRRLIITLIIAIASIVYWTYRTIAINNVLINLADLTNSILKLSMTNSDYLNFKMSTPVTPALTMTSIWLTMINGFMVAMSFVLIYTEIKKFREPKDALNSDSAVAKPE